MTKPPFLITNAILNASMQITKLLGALDGLKMERPQVVLRKENRIKTIQASLAIEGNTLSLEQVSDILDGVGVIGPEKEILEVKNAITLYKHFHDFNYQSSPSLNKAHKYLMSDLVKDAGKFRAGNVGVFAGSKVAHVAPSHKIVPKLIEDLFGFIKQDEETSLLIKSCIFHYELEFIHPYADGNGRVGRFWQHLMLAAFHPVFEYVSVEGLIKEKQKEYYAVLAKGDRDASSTLFIEFILEQIVKSLENYVDNIKYQPKSASERLEYAKQHILAKEFSRQDYLKLFKDISSATASRDLKYGVDHKVLMRTGDKRVSIYKFI